MLVSAVQRSELAIQIHLSLFFWISFSFRSPMASLVAQLVKIHLQCGRPGFDPWVAKSPWRGERLSTPVFWPGESPSLYSPWGRKESDTTEWLSLRLPQTPEMNREIGIGHIYTSDMCTKQITDENLLCSTRTSLTLLLSSPADLHAPCDWTDLSKMQCFLASQA